MAAESHLQIQGLENRILTFVTKTGLTLLWRCLLIKAKNGFVRKAGALHSLGRMFEFRTAPFTQVPPGTLEMFRNLVLQVPVLFQF